MNTKTMELNLYEMNLNKLNPEEMATVNGGWDWKTSVFGGVLGGISGAGAGFYIGGPVGAVVGGVVGAGIGVAFGAK